LASVKPWWERWPGRLERELAELDSAGISYERDEDSWARGHFRLRVTGQATGGRTLVADFPATYPYFRFELAAEDIALLHHQDPYEKTLCLFGRASGEWSPSFTLARVLEERLPLVIEAGNAVDARAVNDLEEHQAEPISEYFPYKPGGMLIVDGSWTLGEARRGQMLLRVDPAAWPVRGIVEIVRMDGTRLAEAPPELVRSTRTSAELQARWVSLPEAPTGNQPAEVLSSAVSVDPALRRPIWKQLNGHLVDIVGIVFPEETGWRQGGSGWLFHVRTKEGPQGAIVGQHLIRAGRGGVNDLLSRTPRHSGLRDKCVAIVGLGALGAPSALELARAGVGEMHLLDFDYVDPGTSSRWPFGFGVAGLPKTEAVGGFLAAHYPMTKALVWTRRLGQPTSDGTELEMLDRFLDRVDLVYDASAEIGVQQLLSDLAWERSIPYVAVSTTFGARGGLVASLRPYESGGCWLCLQLAIDDGLIEAPPSDADGMIQPVGCASPTFTGSGYDTLAIAVSGVRKTVMMLSGDSNLADVLVITNGVIPTFISTQLDRHPQCPKHV
jgi:molybdopterin/thiamine biosynthesis adenylyltransferase